MKRRVHSKDTNESTVGSHFKMTTVYLSLPVCKEKVTALPPLSVLFYYYNLEYLTILLSEFVF